MTETDQPNTEHPGDGGLRQPPRLADGEIIELARKLVANRLVVASTLPPDMLPHVFMVVAMGGLNGIDLDYVGNVVEDIDKAGPRGINGYPCFFSCQVIHTDDWKDILERAIKARGALDEALKSEEGKP